MPTKTKARSKPRSHKVARRTKAPQAGPSFFGPRYESPIAGLLAEQGGPGSMARIIPAMYESWAAYGYQPSITWYQLAQMYVSWEYIATEKIARTIASLPAKLYRYENSQGKTLRPYHVKSLVFGEMLKARSREYISYKLKKTYGVQRIEIEEHPFLDLINAPNEETIRAEFWRTLAIHLELDGAVGVYKAVPDPFGHPTELHILPATWTGQLKPVPANDGIRLIKGYKLIDQDLHTDFSVDEVFWPHYQSLRNPFEGMSAIKAQLYAFNMDQYISQQITAFYKNGAMFSNLFTTDQPLTQEQYDSIATQLTNYQGAKNAGQKFILHSGLKVDKPITTTARDAMITEIQNLARDKQLAAHDTPLSKIGITENVNRSNMETADMSYFNETIRPRAMFIVEFFNRFLVKLYDPNIDFEFDYPHFNDRQMDISERNSDMQNGLKSRNEIRQDMGLAPVDGGDVILVSPLMQPLDQVAKGAPQGEEEGATPFSPSEKPKEKEGEEDEEGEEKKMIVPPNNKSFWTPERKTIYWKAFDKKAKAYEPLFKKVMVKHFRDMSARCVDLLEKHGVKIKSNIASMNLNGRQQWLAEHKARFDEFLPDKQATKTELKKLLLPVYHEVMEIAGKDRVHEFTSHLKTNKARGAEGTEFDIITFNINDPKVKRWLGDNLEEVADDISQTTIDGIKKILRDGFETGEGLSDLSRDVRDYFDGCEKARADNIARTETTAAMNKADLEAVRQMGLEGSVGKVWLPEQDASVRETHKAAGERYSDGYDGVTGKLMDINAEFVVGEDRMMSPGDGDLAEEVCNCRCTMVYEIVGNE